MEYEPVIGLEVHVELKTGSKIFCGCSTEFGGEANTQVCPVCLGLPGTLPVMNAKAVEYAVRIGMALDCRIAPFSKMDRKNYYYPDLPKAYQISQYDQPLCTGGRLAIATPQGPKIIGITRAHLEEDAGKLVHAGGREGRMDGSEYSLADYNRGGVPLVEIVSEPDLRSAEEAYQYLTTLKNVLLYIEVSDCNMEEGSLRCDANVSVRPKGQKEFGTRTEIKNLNSFKFTKQAIEYEIKRQIALIEKGEKVVQESRLFDPAEGKTRPMRSKEEAHDYRYFPEPDLAPMILEAAYLDAVRASLPELPHAKRARFASQYGLSDYDAGVLTAEKELADWYETGAKHTTNHKGLANWVMGDLAARMKEEGATLADLKFDAKKLADMIALVDAGTINSKQAKDLFAEMYASGREPGLIVKEKGMVQVTDPKFIEDAVVKVMEAHAPVVAEFRSGKEGVIGFLVGKVMQATQGKANPKMVNEVLRAKLKG